MTLSHPTHDPESFPDGYPEMLPAPAIKSLVYATHGREEDWDEGDLEDRIYHSSTYTLTSLPITDLDLDEWAVDPDTVAEIMESVREGQALAPIVFCTLGATIVDGIHRANALHRLGHTHLRAYVGTGDLEADEEDGEDEEADQG